MGSSIPRPVVAQAVVVIMAAALFTGGPYFLDVTADGEWRINVSQVEPG